MFFAVAFLLLPAVTAVSPILVDESVTELRTCRISAIAFRAPDDGWMADHCGGVFRSHDGGRSWTPDETSRHQMFGPRKSDADGLLLGINYVQRMLWLDARRGLAMLYGTPAAFRTEDGGRSWSRVELPSPDPEHKLLYQASEMIYGLDHVGDHLWYCGSTGRVTRSSDGGKTWVRGDQQLFEIAGINPQNWCAALSFVDSKDGWAAGWRSMWATHDGGRTWTSLPPVLGTPRSEKAAPLDRSDEVRGMVRLTATRAWAFAGDRLMRTLNGGRSWTEAPAPPPPLRPDTASRPDGRPLPVLKTTAARFDQLVPLDPKQWAVVRPHELINLSLDLYRDGALVRRGPPTTPSLGRTVALQGTTEVGDLRWGWAQSGVFLSMDRGASWFRVGQLEHAVSRLVALNTEALLAKVDHQLFRSKDQGRHWVDATNEVSARSDWERLTGESLGLTDADSLTCTLASPSSLTLEFGGYGCFGGTTNTLHLEFAANGTSHLTAEWKEWRPDTHEFDSSTVDTTLSARETNALVHRLADAATRPEEAPDCWSTSHTVAKLTWTCGKAAARTLSFEGTECFQADFDGGTVARVPDPKQSYSRAIGLNGVAKDFLAARASR